VDHITQPVLPRPEERPSMPPPAPRPASDAAPNPRRTRLLRLAVPALALATSLGSYWVVSAWLTVESANAPVAPAPTVVDLLQPAAAEDATSTSAPSPRAEAHARELSATSSSEHSDVRRTPRQRPQRVVRPLPVSLPARAFAVADAVAPSATVLPVEGGSEDAIAPREPAPAPQPAADSGNALPPLGARVQAATRARAAPPTAAPLEAKLHELVVRGGLVPSLVRQAITRILPKFSACQAQQGAAGQAPAAIRIELRIDEVGRVRFPTVTGTRDEALTRCLSAAAARLVTRAPDTGVVRVVWTLDFAPATDAD
jgi:hypothetical protein